MKLKEMFPLSEGPLDPTFQNPSTPAAPQQAQQAPAVKRQHTLPSAVQGYLTDIERMCSKLVRYREGDPELKGIVHKFLLDLNKWMGEEG